MNGAHMPIATPRLLSSIASRPARAFAAVCTLCLVLTATARAEDKKPEPDVVVFTNGDQLTGTVERGMGDCAKRTPRP